MPQPVRPQPSARPVFLAHAAHRLQTQGTLRAYRYSPSILDHFMQRIARLLLLALLTCLCLPWSTTTAAQKGDPPNANPKPEEILRGMADYLGKLPAFSCRMEAALETKLDDDVQRKVTKMTARLARPNRLSLVMDEGEMGMTVISDGKKLTQYLPILKRYAVSDAPANYADMTDIGVPLKITILGTIGELIPAKGDDYFKLLTSAVSDSKYVGSEKINGVVCHHLRFTQKRFDWDIWIGRDRPIVEKVILDLSKSVQPETATAHYTVKFSDWNVSPKFKDSDFAFAPPADAVAVDMLIPPDPPHPLVGKPAPAFKTEDENGHPFDLRKHLGKDVVMLEFWATSCGACILSMPDLAAVAQKYADRGVVFRAVNGGEDAETIKQFLELSKFKVPIALDPELEIWHAYGVEVIPHTVLIGKDGKVHVVHDGYNQELGRDMAKQIEALLAGKDLAGEALAKAKGRKPSK
jgi:peroxiredoxin